MDEKKELETSSRVSEEQDSTDDEVLLPDSDSHLPSKLPPSVIESFPNSPASITHRYVLAHTSTCHLTQVRVISHRYVSSHTGTCLLTQVHVISHRYVSSHTGTCHLTQVRVISHRYMSSHTGMSLGAPIPSSFPNAPTPEYPLLTSAPTTPVDTKCYIINSSDEQCNRLLHV